MTRTEAFHWMGTCPVRMGMYKRLNAEQKGLCLAFIAEHDHEDHNQFALALDRWYMDQPKPRRYNEMWALLLESNSKAGSRE